ncbi:hypothetical protein [Streptomyces sp. NPDC046751]|uniref:hypothetical protein n=2 Tax=Streptomyces TaxID=1883 RepID=UPI0033E0E00E
MSEHLADVEASLAFLETLRQRLAHIHNECVSDRALDISALISALRTMGSAGPASEQALWRHLGNDQIRTLRDRAAALGPATHHLLEVERPEPYRRAEALRTAGAEPTAPRVRKEAGGTHGRAEFPVHRGWQRHLGCGAVRLDARGGRYVRRPDGSGRPARVGPGCVHRAVALAALV